MAGKVANVNTRMELDIKNKAESILENLGIPRSVAIDMFYRQIIAHNGIPFPVTLPTPVPIRSEMTKAQYDEMMETGLRQAKTGETYDVDEAFAILEKAGKRSEDI